MISEEQKPSAYPFSLAPLPFAYDALEPYIDTATLQIHHTKHHQAYITNLNAALEGYPQLHGFSIEELLQRLDKLPIAIRQTVHDQGGGHLHHQFFWSILKSRPGEAKPAGALAVAIDRDFGSLDAFREKFIDTGTRHFASGWVFLAMDPATGKLEVFARADHNNLLPEKKYTLLINDLWEHAYYLQYRNDRAEYLKSFWAIVDWEYVGQLYKNASSSKDRLAGAIKRRIGSLGNG